MTVPAAPELEEPIYFPSKKARGSKTTKKVKKAKITKESNKWEKPQNEIEAIHDDRAEELDED